MNESLGTLFALASSLLLAAFVLLIRQGTSDGRGTPAEAIVIVLATTAILHGISGLVVYFPVYRLSTISVLSFVAAGITGSVIARRFFLEGIARLGAATADSLKASTPAFSFLWAVTILREPAHWHAIVGIVGITVGLILISRREALSDAVEPTRIRPVDVLIPLAAAFFYSIEPICVRFGLIQGTPSLLGLSVQSSSAALLYIVYAALFGKIPSGLHRSRALGWFIAAGFASAGFLLLYNHALSLSSVVRVFPITQISPLLVIAFSWTCLRSVERIRARLVVGAAMVACGAVAVSL
ncbi:EamA family transporter [Candidatus Bipolaricaulota bacterium]